MFSPSIYAERRAHLARQGPDGLLLFPGNALSPMNYGDNPYPFRQDSTFLYYFGVDEPDLAGVIDTEDGSAVLFGDDIDVETVVWTGPLESLAAKAERAGVARGQPAAGLAELLEQARARGRAIHFPPQYRHDNLLRLAAALGVAPDQVNDLRSEALVRAVIDQRAVKQPEEVAEIRDALRVCGEIQQLAREATAPGRLETEVAGRMEGHVLARGLRLAFPTILTTSGQYLHNMPRPHPMQAGQIALNDSGVESAEHYAGDITRSCPVSPAFTDVQRAVYDIVLEALNGAIAIIRPGLPFREVHRTAAEILVRGLAGLGLMTGDAAEAVETGAYALFFPCGVGHMLGLDVHDMEPLGEEWVGYDEQVRRRPEFGWRNLRMGRALRPGFVVTVEPGVYFVPELIDRWQAEGRFTDFIRYDRLGPFRDFGGIRIEDNILVTPDGGENLSADLPKSREAMERPG